MKRSERVKDAVWEGIERASANCARDGIPYHTAIKNRTLDHVLARLSVLPVVPKFEGVEGVDYSIDAIEDVRVELAQLRDHAKKNDQARWVVVLDHALIYLSLLVAIIKEHHDDDRSG